MQDKVKGVLNILEQNETISLKNNNSKETQLKIQLFFFANGDSLEIVIDERYLNSRIDEWKRNSPIEATRVKLTKIMDTNADMNSAYNRTPLDKKSVDLLNLFIKVIKTNLIG